MIAIWFVLISLITWAYFEPNLPEFLPLGIYIFAVLVRGSEKYYNYKDWLSLNQRDEENAIENFVSDLASRGLSRGGRRTKGEKEIKENFSHERNKQRRALYRDLIDCLFLK